MATNLHLRFSREFGPFAAQKAAVQAALSGKYTSVGYIGGLGSGKTRTAAYCAIALSAANPRVDGMVFSPTYGMLHDAMLPTLIDLLEENEIPYKYLHEAGRPRIRLPWDSEIWCRSAEKPERLKGPNLGWVIGDEAGIMKQRAWLEAGARVRHPRAKVRVRMVTTTPEGFGWVYDEFGTGRERTFTVNANTAENRALPETYVQELLNSMDEQHAKAYVEGRFVPLFQRQVYYNFLRDRNVEPVEYSASLPLYWSHDFNVDPMCSVIFQVGRGNDRRPTIRVIDEIVLANSNTPEACSEFLERYRDHSGLMFIGGDPSGYDRDTRQASRRSDFDIIEDELVRGMKRASVERYIENVHPPLSRRHNTVNALLRSASGRVSLLVNPRCAGVITSFERTVRKEGSQVVDKDVEWKRGRHTFHGVEHSTDALGYPLCLMFSDPRDIRHSQAEAA